MVDMHGFAIADERGTILLNQTSLPDSSILETLDSGDSKALLRRNIYSSSDHNFQNLRMVYMGNIAGLQEEISNIRYWLLGFGSLIFLISFLLANQISKKMLQPLAPLLQAISDPSPLHRPPVETVQKKRRLSFQDSILWYLLSIVLAGSILLSAASFCFFSHLITQKVSASAESSFRQVSNNVQQLMDNLVAASRYICYDDGTQQLLRDPKAASGQQKPLFGMELFTYDTATCLYGNGRAAILSSNPSLFPQRNPQLPKNDVIWGYNEHSKNNHYFSLLMSINDKISYLPIGALQTKLDELFLEKQYAILSSAHCEAYVHTKDGLIVSHPNKNFIGATLPPTDNSGTPRDENRICLRYRIAGTPFYLTASYSRDMIAAEKRSLLISSGYILVIMLLSVFLTSFWLSHLLSARFHKLSDQLAGMDLDHLYPAEHEDSMIEEIAQMNRAFDAMVCRIQKLVEESLESADRQHALELSRNRAEFQMLQSQINPHFLYNTFESVNFMIRTDKRGQAISMLNGLSHMLRFAAKKDAFIIALAEEESYAKTYVEIMNMRYADIMTVTMNIPQELLPLHIIKFVLQPLIENAIYHGVRPKGFGGEITVTGQVADHKLLLSVRDNGMGMSQEKLAELVSDLAENKKKDTIGLSNIHNRIRMTYGAPYGLRISSREEHGTTVTIILPLLP